MICTCGHGALTHAYIPIIGDNVGRCLAARCDCTFLEEDN